MGKASGQQDSDAQCIGRIRSYRPPHTQGQDPQKRGLHTGIACRARWEPGDRRGRQWSAYLHGVGHVVIRCVIDAGKEVLTQLWREEPGCLAPDYKDAPAWGAQATAISTFSPQKTEPLSTGTAPGVLAEPHPADVGGSASPAPPQRPAGPACGSSQQAQLVGARRLDCRCSETLASCGQTVIHPVSGVQRDPPCPPTHHPDLLPSSLLALLFLQAPHWDQGSRQLFTCGMMPCWSFSCFPIMV